MCMLTAIITFPKENYVNVKVNGAQWVANKFTTDALIQKQSSIASTMLQASGMHFAGT